MTQTLNFQETKDPPPAPPSPLTPSISAPKPLLADLVGQLSGRLRALTFDSSAAEQSAVRLFTVDLTPQTTSHRRHFQWDVPPRAPHTPHPLPAPAAAAGGRDLAWPPPLRLD